MFYSWRHQTRRIQNGETDTKVSKWRPRKKERIEDRKKGQRDGARGTICTLAVGVAPSVGRRGSTDIQTHTHTHRHGKKTKIFLKPKKKT